MNGDGVDWKKAEGGCQKWTTSSLMDLSDGSNSSHTCSSDVKRGQTADGTVEASCEAYRPEQRSCKAEIVVVEVAV